MPNDDAINIVNRHYDKERQKSSRSRVSNNKGEVIGIVELTEALMKDIRNLVKYALADKQRTAAFLTSLGLGTLLTIGEVKYVAAYMDQKKAELNNAQALSVNSAMVALETETLDDDTDVVNDLMGKVYYPTLEDRLKNLLRQIDSLNSADPSIDKGKLLEEYKQEYAAVVKEAQESGVYYGLGEEHTQNR